MPVLGRVRPTLSALRARWSRWPRWARRAPWVRSAGATDSVVRALLGVWLAVKVLEPVLGDTSSYPDSPTYRVSGTWLDFSLTSLDGHSVRPWGVTAWQALWPGDWGIALGQALLSWVAWSALAVTVAATLRRPAVRRATVVALLLVASSAQVAGWDLNLLGESVSVSTGVLALAALLGFVGRPDAVTGSRFVLAALWFSMTRPNLFFTLVGWAVTLAVLGVLRRRLRPWGLVAAGLALCAAYSAAYNIRSDLTWSQELGYSRSTVAYGYPISENGPANEAVLRDLRRSDAPACMIPSTPNEVSNFGTTAWIAARVKTCPGMDAWAREHWNSWWAGWLLHHPDQAWTIIGVELPSSLSPPVWSGVVAATPDPVSQLFFGSPALPQSAHPDRTYRTEPVLGWLVAAAVLALLARRRARAAGRRSPPEPPVGPTLVGTLAGTLATAVSSGLLIQTAPFEVGQESMGALVVGTVSLVLLVAVGLDRLVAGQPPGRVTTT